MGAAEALGGARQYRFRGAGWIFANVTVPDAEHGPSLLGEPLIADNVPLGLRVLTAVDFDDQLCLAAREIHDVRPYRQLPRELRPVT